MTLLPDTGIGWPVDQASVLSDKNATAPGPDGFGSPFGAQWSISLSCIERPAPDGRAQAYPLTKDSLEGERDDRAIQVEQMGRGYAWLDTGTRVLLLDAGYFVRALTGRQGS